MTSKIKIKDLGLLDYKSAWDFQKDFHKKVILGVQPDTLFFVEHEPVYTFGKNADKNHLLQSADKDIKIFNVERGGDVTFHGPGQIVGYPIIDLNRYVKSVSWYMRTLEEVLIETLATYSIEAKTKEGLTGVWVGDEKIGAQGVRISRWVTMHGFALNVNTDLTYFDGIIPCGIFEHGVTSMSNILNENVEYEHVKKTIIKKFINQFKIDHTLDK